MGVIRVKTLFCNFCGKRLEIDEFGSDCCYWCMIKYNDEWLLPQTKNKIKLHKNREEYGYDIKGDN